MRAFVLALVVGLLVTLSGYAVEAATGDEGAVLGPGEVTVTVDIDHSRFSMDRLRVRAGTLVRFVVRNDDPIHHELVVGPDEVHAQHRGGTDLVHPPIPGEVSLGPYERGMTFYVFDEPGPVAFACHLPGHEAYGMVGEVDVIR